MTDWRCLICRRPIPDFEPIYCCSGEDCGCHGEPIDPPVCSDACHDALMQGIGKPFDERRRDAGIDDVLRTELAQKGSED